MSLDSLESHVEQALSHGYDMAFAAEQPQVTERSWIILDSFEL